MTSKKFVRKKAKLHKFGIFSLTKCKPGVVQLLHMNTNETPWTEQQHKANNKIPQFYYVLGYF